MTLPQSNISLGGDGAIPPAKAKPNHNKKKMKRKITQAPGHSHRLDWTGTFERDFTQSLGKGGIGTAPA